MNKLKILKDIRDTYSDREKGLKKLKKLKLVGLIGYVVLIVLAFQFDLFNLEERFIFVFLFIFVSVFLSSLFTTAISGIQNYEIVKEVIDMDKVEELIKEEEQSAE